MKSFLVFFLLIFVFGTSAQTNLSVVQKDGQNFNIEKISIERFSRQKSTDYSFKEGMTVSFEEKYADLYTLKFYSLGDMIYSFQLWFDTGNVKIVLRKGKYTPLELDTVINSPLTNRVDKFLKTFNLLKDGNDSSLINNHMIEAYKQNITNPFSFYIGEFYYSYNKKAVSNYTALNAFENEQVQEIKNSLWYSIMLRRRFSFTERMFVNYFNSNVHADLFGEKVSTLFDNRIPNIFLFLGRFSTQSLHELESFYENTEGFKKNNFNLIIGFDSSFLKKWQPYLKRKDIVTLVIDPNSFLQQTTFYPLTKVYIVERTGEIHGFFNSIDELLKQKFYKIR